LASIDHSVWVAILSDGALLRAETLRFADEVRTPADIGLPKPAKPSSKAVKVARQAIEALTRDALDRDEMGDRYAEEIRSLAEAKASKRKDVIKQAVEAEEEDAESAGGNVIDLMQVLRERLAAKGQPKTAASASRSHSAAASRTRRGASAQARLGKLSKSDLYQRAQNLDIPGRSKMSKKALVEAIRRAS
jgi:DNA end-binding protein Ku